MPSCCSPTPTVTPARSPADVQDLPTAHGEPPVRGRIRTAPEDFRVTEILGFAADGEGPHALLEVEKRGANTGWVAAQLARAAGVQAREVGWSGLKDRDAVTRQSFSLPWPGHSAVEGCLEFGGEGYRVLAASRHGRKLRPGSHRANRFGLTVRDVSGNLDALSERLHTIAAQGVPNYFGPQRFGRAGSNLLRARDWAEGGPAPRDRAVRGYALSAARSEIYNQVAAERVRQGAWNVLLEGEAVLLDGRRSYFSAGTIDETLRERCRTMDVHPSAPLWGRGATPALAAAREIEERALAGTVPLQRLLEAQGLDHERRSVRLPVRGLSWRFDAGLLELEFELPRGAYATAVLHELLAGAWTDEAGVDD
jgi:tRNA pseudouridine13 synthase